MSLAASASASSRFLAMETPFPRASPSALTTSGMPTSSLSITEVASSILLTHVIAGGGKVVALQEILRERFAAFELRGRSVGTEYTEPATLELVREAENQRELGTDHGETDGEILGKISELDDVGGVDVDTIRDARDAGVSRGAVELRYLRALLELPREGVLTPASAYDEHPHEIAVKFNIISSLRYS